MKKFIILIILIILFIACEPFEVEEFEYELPPYITFEEISQPYLDQYGQPEEIIEYKSDNYYSIDWWWWSQQFMVCFVETSYDNVYGWTVDHTYLW